MLARSAVVAVLLSAAPAVALACSPDAVDVVGKAGSVSFSVEIADEPEERRRGLMFRQSMPTDAGMLFLFDVPHQASFWMRNTFIPLDIIFLDASGTVLNVAERTVPFSETPHLSDGLATAVLEVNAGLAEAHGIGPGAQVRHPAFAAQQGALACD
ncbi:MAG: DUF192 domain-containing protein [Pseudomonadota bacterium]